MEEKELTQILEKITNETETETKNKQETINVFRGMSLLNISTNTILLLTYWLAPMYIKPEGIANIYNIIGITTIIINIILIHLNWKIQNKQARGK